MKTGLFEAQQIIYDMIKVILIYVTTGCINSIMGSPFQVNSKFSVVGTGLNVTPTNMMRKKAKKL